VLSKSDITNAYVVGMFSNQVPFIVVAWERLSSLGMYKENSVFIYLCLTEYHSVDVFV